VVLLDRRMPHVSGDEVLATIRERALDSRVGMVTGVTPEIHVLDMAFDDYLVKPVTGGEDFETTEAQFALADADPAVAELAAVTAKLAFLVADATGQELDDSDDHQRLVDRAEEFREQVPDDADGLEYVGWTAAGGER
jgi:DNA-binding response OmpR family regulator